MSAVRADEALRDAILRPMRESDLDEVMRIETRAYPFPWTPGIFRDCLRADYPMWVQERPAHQGPGAIVGYGVLSIAAEEAHVLNLCTAPECEGQGSQARCATLIDRLDQLVAASGLKPRLRDHGIGEGDIPLLAKEAMKQTRLLVNNPCPIEEEDARRLYEAAW